jgi:hypothetical protein
MIVTERKVPKIRTDNVYPPIPVRMFDWQAVYDDDEPDDDGHMAAGHGATEAEAIRDLMDNHPRSGNPCAHCKKPFFFGDTCTMGGCPCGGDV